MAVKLKNLSSYNPEFVPDASDMRFGIVVSEWNPDITNALLHGALKTLMLNGASESEIIIRHIPGSFEIPLAAQFIAESSEVDAVICLGCVIQGDTRHFDYICQGVTQGIMELNLKYNLPFIFGVLTTDNYTQAEERAGGKHGNKGDEAAVTAIKMVATYRTFHPGGKRNHTL